MSVPLTGYETKRLLRASLHARVYEAVRTRDGRRVVAKVFERGDEGVEARVELEFALLQGLEIEGVVRALGIEHVGDQLVLLLDYVPGRNLAEHLGGKAMQLSEFLAAARSLTATLSRVHERRIVHRDIKPSNILIDHAGALYLADFGISVLLETERRHLYDPRILAGTLPYLSPEQTGRTAREVDFRSDLYSLGATFYEMLTGRRPFDATEPLQLIHAHLARRPPAPDELVPSVPRQLAAIVMKLLSKAPENRYQSARGLLADLELLAHGHADGDAEHDFELAAHDFATSLQLPHQLYGRQRERRVLEDELAATATLGERRLLLVSGAPGLGKSALLRAFEAPLAARSGYLAIGRFEVQRDRSQPRELPYGGFVRALASLVDQILTESDERLAQWRARLRHALGPLSPVVVQFVPQLCVVLGELPSAVSLELGEARSRLHLAVARFVSVFATDGPLVLALDDLHGADPNSLELLHALMQGGDSAPVLLVCTYRPDDPDDPTPITEFIAQLQDHKRVRKLQLGPLTDSDLQHMLADVLGRAPEQLAALAQLISNKTDNNPLFVRQYLIHLGDLGLLRPTRDGWQWELSAIAAAKIPDDVLAVMTAKLERLPERELQVLLRAACIGVRFDFSLLDAIIELSRDALVASLHALEAAGLINPVSPVEYQFSHDRVVALARELLAKDAWRGLRWTLGRELLARASARASGPALGDRVFEIVDALHDGQPELELLTQAERLELAQLDVEAGERALSAAAWSSARGYLQHAIELLAPELEHAKRGAGLRELVFAAHFGLAQAAALSGATQAAARGFDELLDWQLSPAEHTQVVARQLRILTLQQHMQQAVALGLAELERGGLRIPAQPSLAWMVLQIIRATRRSKRVTTQALLEQPAITDEQVNATISLIADLKHASLVVNLNLFVGLTCIHARLVLEHGFHPTGAEALAQLAIAVAGTGQPLRARALADTAVALARARPGAAATLVRAEAATLLFAGPCFRSFRECAAAIENGARASLELGERENAGYYGALGLGLHIMSGTHLREVLELEPRLRRELPDWGTHEMAVIADMNTRYVEALALRGERARAFLRRADFAELEISKLTQYVSVVIEFDGHLLLALAESSLTRATQRRLQALTDPIVPDFDKVLFGVWQLPRFAMLHSILLAEQCVRTSSRVVRARALRRMRRHLSILRNWAKGCPENYAAMAELAAGELAMARGQHDRAMACYELAQSLAFDHGVICVEGLACLRIANVATRANWSIAARGALAQARRVFERWGAWGLVQRLEAHDPLHAQAIEFDSLDRSPNGADVSKLLGTGSSGTTLTLDMATILGTLHAIGENLRIEEVITKVLSAAIENAGADRGLLLLDQDRELALVAEGDAAQCREFLDAPVPLRSAGDRLPIAMVNYVLRTRVPLVIDDIRDDSRFSSDPYGRRTGVRALLCMPITKQAERVGALVLENHLVGGAFTSQRLEVLRILLAQAASALDNARLYAALAGSEAQWRSLVDGAPDIIASLDEHGCLEFINHLAGGGSPTAMIGRHLEELMDPPSAARWCETLADVHASRSAREVEISMGNAPDEPPAPARVYMTRVAPIEIEGRVGRLLAIATDITERRAFEVLRRQQQRLESIGTLASGVAHEINNPIQGILNYAELLSEHPNDTETVIEFAAEISTESKRVATIVRNLLAFSRQEQDRSLEVVTVPAVVDSALSLIRAVIRKDHVLLSVELPEQLPTVSCRPQQIQQILMNLVANARDALNDRYRGYDENKTIEIRATTHVREQARWVRLSIRDHAGGIPEAVRAQIFDPFFTTKGRDHGTGLGLSVSHGIAAEHGGELTFETELGVGTVFHLDLPAAET